MLHLLPLELQHYIVFELCWILDWAAIFVVWPHLRVHVTLAENTVKTKEYDNDYVQVWYLVKRQGEFIQSNHLLPTDRLYCAATIVDEREDEEITPGYSGFYSWTRRSFRSVIIHCCDLYEVFLETGVYYCQSDVHIVIKSSSGYRITPKGVVEWRNATQTTYYISKKKALQEWADVELEPEFLPLKPFIARMITLFQELKRRPNITPENLLHLS